MLSIINNTSEKIPSLFKFRLLNYLASISVMSDILDIGQVKVFAMSDILAIGTERVN